MSELFWYDNSQTSLKVTSTESPFYSACHIQWLSYTFSIISLRLNCLTRLVYPIYDCLYRLMRDHRLQRAHNFSSHASVVYLYSEIPSITVTLYYIKTQLLKSMSTHLFNRWYMYKLYNIEALCIISSEVAINRNCSSRFFITRTDTSEFYNYFNM